MKVHYEDGGFYMHYKGEEKHVLVDEVDFEALELWKYEAELCAKKRRRNLEFWQEQHIHLYVRFRVPDESKATGWAHKYLHQLIMNPPEGMIPDHINGNTLDNRRLNLRNATYQQNRENVHAWEPSDPWEREQLATRKNK